MSLTKFVRNNTVHHSNNFYSFDKDNGFALNPLRIELSFDSALVANVLMHYEIIRFSHSKQIKH